MASTFCTECGDLRISPSQGTLATCRVDGGHPTPLVIPEEMAAKVWEMCRAGQSIGDVQQDLERIDDRLAVLDSKLDSILEELRRRPR